MLFALNPERSAVSYSTVSQSDQIVVVMLAAFVLATTIIVGLFATGLANLRKPGFLQEVAADAIPHYIPRSGERPNRWLAIRCTDLAQVQSVLALNNPTPCPLGEGFPQLAERQLFLSPPIRGWILVIGSSLPDPADDVDRLFRFLHYVGTELGTAQYFHTNRVLGHHAWVRIDDGQVTRAYAWAGETLWDQGARTAEEELLDLRTFAYGEALPSYPQSAQDIQSANAERLLDLAALWSIDPLAAHQYWPKAAVGITGDFSRRT